MPFFLVTLVLLILKMIAQMVCPEAVGSLLAWSLLLGRWEVTLLVLPCSGASRGVQGLVLDSPGRAIVFHLLRTHWRSAFPFYRGKMQRGDVTGQGPQLGIEPRPSG